MAKLSTDELLDAFKEMTCSSSEFVKKFGKRSSRSLRPLRSPSPLRAVPLPGRRGRRGADRVRRHPRERRREEDRRHQGRPRDRLRPGLKEAKDLVDGAPKPLLEKATKGPPTTPRPSSRPPAPRSPSSGSRRAVFARRPGKSPRTRSVRGDFLSGYKTYAAKRCALQ